MLQRSFFAIKELVLRQPFESALACAAAHRALGGDKMDRKLLDAAPTRPVGISNRYRQGYCDNPIG